MGYQTNFWDTTLGNKLAYCLIEVLPSIEKNMKFLLQENLQSRKPANQMAVYITPKEVQSYVKEQIDNGRCLVGIIPGNTAADDVLVITKM